MNLYYKWETDKEPSLLPGFTNSYVLELTADGKSVGSFRRHNFNGERVFAVLVNTDKADLDGLYEKLDSIQGVSEKDKEGLRKIKPHLKAGFTIKSDPSKGVPGLIVYYPDKKLEEILRN